MQFLELNVVRLPHSNGIDLPRYQTTGAAGMDLSAAVDAPVRLDPRDVVLIPSGIAIELPSGYEAQVRPRSGLVTKHRVTVANSPGTIDSDYRGEILVALINLGTVSFEVTRGMRVAQLVIAPVVQIAWNEVSNLSPSTRGKEAFGHTGN